MAFWSRRRAAWDLAALTPPWDTSRSSIYSHINGLIVEGAEDLSTLPDDEVVSPPGALRWVAGGLDGAFGHHGGAQPGRQAVEVQKAFEATLADPSPLKLQRLYGLLRQSALEYMDTLLERLSSRRLHLARLEQLLVVERSSGMVLRDADGRPRPHRPHTGPRRGTHPADEHRHGSRKEMGLGPEWAPHSDLDFVLQGLGAFPGKGWSLIRAGVRSPVIRNRYTALKALSAWERGRWPPDAEEHLRQALAAEPELGLRGAIATVLDGQPWPPPQASGA